MEKTCFLVVVASQTKLSMMSACMDGVITTNKHPQVILSFEITRLHWCHVTPSNDPGNAPEHSKLVGLASKFSIRHHNNVQISSHL
jgi:hypothetical protein